MSALICEGARTLIGRYGSALSYVRADDLSILSAVVMTACNPNVDWSAVDEVIYGAANQVVEDNPNVARMAALFACPPEDVSAVWQRFYAAGCR